MTKEEFWKKGNRLCDTINSSTNWGIMLYIIFIALIEDIFHIGKIITQIVYSLGSILLKEQSIQFVFDKSFYLWKKWWGYLNFDDQDIGILVAIMVVIWTFTVSLSINCLEKMDNRYYGVSIADILDKYGMKKIVFIIIFELFQIITMVFAVVYKWKLTLLTICLLQIYTIPAIFCIVMFKTSHENIINYVEDECFKVLSGQMKIEDASIFSKVILNIDYKKENEIKRVEQILIKICNRENPIYSKVTEVMCMIVDSIDDFDVLWNFIKKLFYHSNMFEVRRAIITASLNKFEDKSLQYCTILISMCEKDIFQKLYIWIIVYELYWSEAIGEQWRKKNAYYIVNNYIKMDSEEKIYLALKYWEEISRTKDNIYILQKFLSV